VLPPNAKTPRNPQIDCFTAFVIRMAPVRHVLVLAALCAVLIVGTDTDSLDESRVSGLGTLFAAPAVFIITFWLCRYFFG
jgi:hypothetical protein